MANLNNDSEALSKSSPRKPTQSIDYSEKRNFTRMSIDTPIRLTYEGSKESIEGRCKNLSGTGMLIETGKRLKIGNKVHIVVPSERPELKNLNALAEVIRVIHLHDQHKFEVGLIIRNMN